jgi:hypothetical protein
MKHLSQVHHAGHGASPGEHWQTDPAKGTKMEMTYVGGLADRIHTGEPSRYVGGLAGRIHTGEPSRYVGGLAGWIHTGEPSRYVGGLAGWVSCQTAASAAPEPSYVLAS